MATTAASSAAFKGRFSIFSYPLYTYLRDHTPEFEEMAAFQARPARKSGVRRAGAQRLRAIRRSVRLGQLFHACSACAPSPAA